MWKFLKVFQEYIKIMEIVENEKKNHSLSQLLSYLCWQVNALCMKGQGHG